MAKEKKINNTGAYYPPLNEKSRLKIRQAVNETMENIGTAIENTGLFLTKKDESLPIYGPIADEEFVISRKKGAGSRGSHAGSRIVLTKDNYGHRGTGMGGHGFTMCEAIDIVAGSLTSERKIYDSSTKSRANFITDGARIYLTERGDINTYFAIGRKSESVSLSSKMKSGIGMKADQTLIMGRERVSILAGMSAAEGGDRTAAGNEEIVPKVVIGTTQGEEVQQAVLGNALVMYLGEINDELLRLRNAIVKVKRDLMNYKKEVAKHTHEGKGIGQVAVMESTDLEGSIQKHYMSHTKSMEKLTRDTVNCEQTYRAACGSSGGELQGSPEKRILSTAVYIGK